MRFDIRDLAVPGHSVLRGSSLAFLLALAGPWQQDQRLGPKGRARVKKNNPCRGAVSASSGHSPTGCEAPCEVLQGLLWCHLLKLPLSCILDHSEEVDRQCWASDCCPLVFLGIKMFTVHLEVFSMCRSGSEHCPTVSCPAREA